MQKNHNIPMGKITDEGLAEFTRRIGKKMIMDGNELACRETIRKWVDGVGDVNPLFRNREHAIASIWGSMMAPPSFLYSAHPSWAFQGLPGVVGYHAGNNWEFYLPIYEGDRILPECIFQGYDEREGNFAGRMIFERYKTNYYNQNDELVGIAKAHVARVERGGAQNKAKETKLEVPHPWKPKELDAIFDEAVMEQAAGANAPIWNEVNIGDKITRLIKGPIGVGDMVAFIGGGFSSVASTGVALKDYAKRPKWAFRDPDTNALEPMPAVHWNVKAARTGGAAYAYDIGIQRNSWLIQALTNWAGDAGWLKTCNTEYRGFVYLGDALFIEGEITRKFIDEDNEACVEITSSTKNQRGFDTMPAKSIIALPTNDGKPSPAARRFRK